MSQRGDSQVNRRDFLQAGAASAATGTALSVTSITPVAAQEAQAKGDAGRVLPRRKLGKTGVEVTILNQGTWKSPDSLDRLLRIGYAGGIRYIDTAKSYGSEPGVGKFLAAMGAATRKQIFLATKSVPRSPDQMPGQLDTSLEALQTDYVDLFFHHAMGDHGEPIDLVKSPEFRRAAEKIKASGKAKFIGFSCHHARKADYLVAAAESGIIDVVMVAYTPWLDKDAPLNRALDACHKAGVGLISMKQVAGNGDAILKEVPKHVPTLKEKGLSAYQGLLHAIWTDERIATCCVSMRNTDQLRENMQAARVFSPMNQAEMSGMRDAILAAGPSFCANCDGSCSRAAGTEANLGELARLVTYHDHYGFRGEARKLYAEMAPEHRDYASANLDAARDACHNKLDFARLFKTVEDHLA
ncbi:MAG: aldo/keto reductase [Isosphaeraceae bacterium]